MSTENETTFWDLVFFKALDRASSVDVATIHAKPQEGATSAIDVKAAADAADEALRRRGAAGAGK